VAVLRAASIIYSDEQLEAYLYGLGCVGYVDFLCAVRDGRPFPPLYNSGVRYEREPPASEVWQSARAVFANKRADCEDLAGGTRVPELWFHGETAARAIVKRINDTLRHILVERGDGTIEDPSLILGMHADEPEERAAARAAVKPVRPTPGVPFGRFYDPRSFT
jgi:hypothetical protein